MTSHHVGEWPSWFKARASGARDREFESPLPDQILAVPKGNTMTDSTCNVLKPDKGVPIKAWTKGVPANSSVLSPGARSAGPQTNKESRAKFNLMLLGEKVAIDYKHTERSADNK